LKLFDFNHPLMSYWQTWYFISQSKTTIKVTCLFFDKPEVNRADLSYIFSLRPSNPFSSGHTRKSSLSPSFPWTPVETQISLRCRYALWPSFSFRNEGHDPDLVFHRLAGYSIGFFLKPIILLILSTLQFMKWFCFNV
jgi:hypothetical protein